MKRNEIISEIGLGDYRKKAAMQKAQSQMGAMFARDPEERAKELSTFNKREKGLNRLKARDEKARKAAADKDMADTIAQLPQLKDEYEQMKAKYKSLGGSNWQYADREQNLTDREREARSMEGPMNNLWRRISAAEKAQKSESANISERVTPEWIEVNRKAKELLAKGMTVDQVAKQLGVQGPNNGMTGSMGGLWGAINAAKQQMSSANTGSLEETGMLKVAKDDEKQTILQNPTTGVQTQIDKTNPNAPRLAQDDKGKLTLQMPQGAQSGGLGDKPAPLVGKEVQVDQMPAMEAIKRLAGL